MTAPETSSPPDAQAFVDMQASPEFQELRRRLRSFVFPMAGFFLVWYVIYVLLSTYAVDFMSTKVWGNINVGLLLGLGQFVTTFAITGISVNSILAPQPCVPRWKPLREPSRERISSGHRHHSR